MLTYVSLSVLEVLVCVQLYVGFLGTPVAIGPHLCSLLVGWQHEPFGAVFGENFILVFFSFYGIQLFCCECNQAHDNTSPHGVTGFFARLFRALGSFFFSFAFPLLYSRNNRGGGGFKHFPRGYRQMGRRGL